MGKLTNLNPPAPIADADLPASIARDLELSAAMNAHLGAADPHPGYALESSFFSYGDIPSATPVTGAINFMAGGATAAQRSQNGGIHSFSQAWNRSQFFWSVHFQRFAIWRLE